MPGSLDFIDIANQIMSEFETILNVLRRGENVLRREEKTVQIIIQGCTKSTSTCK